MITYHHIGGRNGTYPLPLKAGPLLKDFHLVLYDADDNCLQQMHKAQGDSEWGQLSIFPYCIGGETGQGLFHLNYHPTTNSLYPFNDIYQRYNMVDNPVYGQYVLGDACKLIETVDLELFSLKDVLVKENISSLDFISLDVQGAEYDILFGSKDIIQEKCVGVQLEAEFVKLYKGQKTFFDINVLMEEMGFELLELESFGRFAPMPLPVGFRGKEQPLYAEAIYIKSIDSLLKSGDDEQIYKAALFSLIHKKVGLCLKLLSSLSERFEERDFSSDALLYKRMLSKIWQLYNESKDVSLPFMASLFSNERFQNYYGMREQGKQEFPSASLNHELLPEIQTIQEKRTQPLEELLMSVGLVEVAGVVKEQRKREAHCYVEILENA